MHLLKYDKLMELGNKYYANGQLENARLVFTVAIVSRTGNGTTRRYHSSSVPEYQIMGQIS